MRDEQRRTTTEDRATKGSIPQIHTGGIWALPVRGVLNPSPDGLGHFFRRRSAPECLFECGGWGAKAIRAMPKCPQYEFEGASLTYLLLVLD